MYIKYADYQPDMQLGENDSVLMSLQELFRRRKRFGGRAGYDYAGRRAACGRNRRRAGRQHRR